MCREASDLQCGFMLKVLETPSVKKENLPDVSKVAFYHSFLQTHIQYFDEVFPDTFVQPCC